MSTNKRAKEELIRIYGEKCFIEKLGLRDTSKLKYKGKKQYVRMKMLTYHHIRMKSRGGQATVENGALLSAENHQWFHQQSEAEQARLNDIFQEYKRQVDNGISEECQVVITQDIPKFVDVRVATLNPNEFSRAKAKRKTQERLKEYHEEEER